MDENSESMNLLNHKLSEAALRKQAEEDFHDHAREGTDTRPNRRFYRLAGTSSDYFRSRFTGRLEGAKYLDYGCGDGKTAIWAAKQGAIVEAIDISRISIGNAERAAHDEGLGDRIKFRVMDAEEMAYGAGTFDLIGINGVLHHLDLRNAYAELVRVLKPTGLVVADEAIRHNPLIHAYRKRTPDLRTAWEVDHILGKAEIELGREYFGRLDVRHFHLLSLVAVPLIDGPYLSYVLPVLDAADSVLLRVPGLQWLGWQAVFTLSNPL